MPPMIVAMRNPTAGARRDSPALSVAAGRRSRRPPRNLSPATSSNCTTVTICRSPAPRRSVMTPEQTRALVSVALMAAFADGLKDERERARIKSLATRLSAEGLDVDAIYEDVLMRKPSLASVAAPLVDDRNLALYAYEIAVGVADADGVH